MTDTTDHSLHEALSALVDGECSEAELDRLLNALEEENASLYQSQAANASETSEIAAQLTTEAGLRGSWKRMHLSKSISQNLNFDPKVDLSRSIAQAIASEAAPDVINIDKPVAATWFNWRDFAGKTAIAASVAFAFVAGVQFLNPSSSDGAGSGLVAGNEVRADASISGAVAERANGGRAESAQNLPGANVPQGFDLPPLSARTVSAGDVNNANRASRISPVTVNSNLPTGAVVIRNAEMDEYVNRLLYKHAEQSASASALGVIPYARVSDIEAAEEHEVVEGEVSRQATSEYTNEVKKD